MTAKRAGKSILVAAGAGFGLMQSLRILANIGRDIGQTATSIQRLDARVDTLDVAVARLAEQIERLNADSNQRVTREELKDRMDRMFHQMDSRIEERFERQTTSVEALRLMVAQTDELLQRVLEGLEALPRA